MAKVLGEAGRYVSQEAKHSAQWIKNATALGHPSLWPDAGLPTTRISAWLVGIYLLLAPTLLIADARVGEFFGYKIGDKYPVTISTKARLHWLGQAFEITAEQPKKPEKMGVVRVITSLKSLTIAAINCSTEFKNYDEARRFALHFSEILKAQYDIKKWADAQETLAQALKTPYVPKLNGPLSLISDLNEEYRMQILLTNGEKENSWMVEISLKPMGARATELSKLADKEYDEVVIEQAKKKKELEGL
jgi:hypothetical protein